MATVSHTLDGLRDHGLFLFRATAGGTFIFYGVAELGAGPGAWARIGGTLGLVQPAAMAAAGLAVAMLFAAGGALLVLGMWTRATAAALGGALVGAAVVRWPEVHSGTLEGAAAFFYPLTLAAAMGALAAGGGGRFGLDAVRRGRAHRRR